jgi:predicted helicase
MTTIHDVLEQFREAATSNRDLGDKFERLIASYLTTDPLYQEKYSDVWLWSEWPGRANRPDVGIDLVAKERYTGELCAIQCKFYDPSASLQKSDIDSFFTASGKAPFSSRLIVSTTDKWSVHAEEALQGQHIPVSRLRVQDLADSPVDWSKFSLNKPGALKLRQKKVLREHQKLALKKVMAGFEASPRGKLIMACGTGKTLTALRIAEDINKKRGLVLFLVPSISLLSQSLREWTAEAQVSLRCFAVCSDAKVGKRSESEDISSHDLAFPASTDAKRLADQVTALSTGSAMTVIFSTYQSIDVISKSQARGVPEFDLVVCDEAHRTTGVTLEGDEDSQFVRVHDSKFIKAKRRLYMTATPRIYADSTKTQAEENDAVLVSMDDAKIFGPEFHRLGFSEAVANDLLSDYKVMVLAVDEKFVSKAFQRQIADQNSEINLEDAVKITGCWNGLSKRLFDAHGVEVDTSPMRRAVAFCRSIKDSKRIAELFAGIINQYRSSHTDDTDFLKCEVEHVDGTFNALQRNEKLDWLKADTSSEGNVCRILSNARCLSEGVDVPALDAVMFLNPRNSVVDVVQSVGRVMRKAPGKKYGYVILPIGIPTDVAPEEALQNNQKYRVVWQVLQALRAHDDRFNATVNQIELNKQRPAQIQVIGVGGADDGSEKAERGAGAAAVLQLALNFPHLEDWRDAIYAKIVLKCGDRRYWESWAKDVAQIAERHITRIRALLEGANPKHRKAFNEFLEGLRTNLNPSINEKDAVEMLSQHLITKPVFDALFEHYEFTKHNPVSVAMQKMLDLLEGQALEKETSSLEKFYASVKARASGIDNAEGRQRIIVELYDKFFRTAFPRMAERLGIVYTPVEVVDFILGSADYALRSEFGVGIGDKNVHVIDPFTGTGTFLVRLLQSGLIGPNSVVHKYKAELHANELVLLAYYIAAINIEEAYHGIVGGEYVPFEGIVLTDTFQMTEGKNTLKEVMFPENNKRVARQSNTDIRVIVGNPPYSVGQDSQNDGNQNIQYPHLDERIRATYAAKSAATLKRNSYDSYTRAFRWASDRIKEKGVICFVSNSSLVTKNSMDGLRKSFAEEFSAIYCFNLRGDQRTAGDVSRMEGGKIFGSGSRAGVAITVLVKNPEHSGSPKLMYCDIGDYLSREDKLRILREARNIANVSWQRIVPNNEGDWINQRDPAFDKFMPMGSKGNEAGVRIFSTYSMGVATNRDAWVYSFSKQTVARHVKSMVAFCNEQVAKYERVSEKSKKSDIPVEEVIDTDPKRISWTRALKADVKKGKRQQFRSERIVPALYRPFCKQWLYFDRSLNEMVLKMPTIFPGENIRNLAICVVSPGARQPFSALMTDTLPDLHLAPDGVQCFPLWYYTERDATTKDLFSSDSTGLVQQSAISDAALAEFRARYDKKVTEEDIFYYVYGVLHSNEYKTRFGADLKKVLPRIPFAKDFWGFSKAGRELASLHVNYEKVTPFKLKESSDVLLMNPDADFKVTKMAFARGADKKPDKTAIVINSNITVSGIPLVAYDYVVNGKSAIEWVMERYQVTRDSDSGIVNDPNEWADNARYIIDLLKRVVAVSVATVAIVDALPLIREQETQVAAAGQVDAKTTGAAKSGKGKSRAKAS